VPDTRTFTPHPLEQLAALFEPPDETYLERAADTIEALREAHPVAARLASDFLVRVDGLSPVELGELFAQTFDQAPAALPTALQALRRLRFVERDVQPSYITRVVAPAIERDLARLGEQRNPFIHLLKATLCVPLPLSGETTDETS